jgi:hypothetical protein
MTRVLESNQTRFENANIWYKSRRHWLTNYPLRVACGHIPGTVYKSCLGTRIEYDMSEPIPIPNLNALNLPPFVPIQNVINIRAIGGYSASHPDLFAKPRFLYRSGELTRISEEGKDQLRALGITTVFDLRSKTEIASYDTPAPNIEGVEIVWAPVSQQNAYDPSSLATRYVGSIYSMLSLS